MSLKKLILGITLATSVGCATLPGVRVSDNCFENNGIITCQKEEDGRTYTFKYQNFKGRDMCSVFSNSNSKWLMMRNYDCNYNDVDLISGNVWESYEIIKKESNPEWVRSYNSLYNLYKYKATGGIR